MITNEPKPDIEIPSEAYPFVIGYLTGSNRDLVREALAAWHRSEKEYRKQYPHRNSTAG